MSTLYIRLPSRAAAGSAPQWPALPCAFALVSHGRVPHGVSIWRQGVMPLPDLSDTISRAQRVVLLLAASDVTLLRVKVPPLSPARLKAALPNPVEDQLIDDPSDCVIVAGGIADDCASSRWRNAPARYAGQTLTAPGARQTGRCPRNHVYLIVRSIRQPGSVAVAVNEHDNAVDMTSLVEHDASARAITQTRLNRLREVIRASARLCRRRRLRCMCANRVHDIRKRPTITAHRINASA